MTDNSPEAVASVLKVFGILEALSEERNIGVTDLSKKVMMSKSTVYRFLQTMKGLGYINQEGESDKYSLNVKLFELSNRALENQDFIKIADEEMRRLNEITKETVHLAVRENSSVVYINKINSGHYNLCASSQIGSHASLHSTGLGKILIAWLEKDIQQNIINSIEFIPYTDKTITTAKNFLDELELVKKQGYAEDNEETELGLHCFAVPIYNHINKVSAGLSLSTSIFRCDSEEKKQNIIDNLHQAAAEISKKLGAHGYPFEPTKK